MSHTVNYFRKQVEQDKGDYVLRKAIVLSLGNQAPSAFYCKSARHLVSALTSKEISRRDIPSSGSLVWTGTCTASNTERAFPAGASGWDVKGQDPGMVQLLPALWTARCNPLTAGVWTDRGDWTMALCSQYPAAAYQNSRDGHFHSISAFFSLSCISCSPGSCQTSAAY